MSVLTRPVSAEPERGSDTLRALPSALLSTKISPPHLRPEALLSRADIHAMLDKASERALTQVIAPPGYGKTTALGDWYNGLDRSEIDAAWLTADETDDDPAYFVHHLVASLEYNVPDMRGHLSSLAPHRHDIDLSSFAISLINAVEGRGRPLLILIDDLQAIGNTAVLDMVSLLANSRSRLLHLVLGSRNDPSLRVSKLRALGEMAILRADTLKFSAQDARALFSASGHEDIPDTVINSIVSDTEGWIAGIKLAILAMDNPVVSHGERRLSLPEADIAAFLRDEVMAVLPPHVAQFVLEAAVIGEFSTQLCNHAMGRSDSAAMIAELESRQLFINAVGQPGWYRFHQLFAEAAASMLHDDRPDRKAELNNRCAAWFAQEGFPGRALRHAFASGNPECAAIMLDRVAQTLVQSGRGMTLVRYADMLPQELLAEYPDVQLEQVYSLTLNWRFSEAKRILRDVRGHLMAPARVNRWRERGLDVERIQRKLIYDEMQLAVLRDNAPQADTLARQWLAMDGAYSAFEDAVSQTSLLYAEREQFQVGNLAAGSRAREIFVTQDNRWGTIWHDCIIGAGYAQRGDLDRARSIFEGAFATAVDVTGRSSPTTAMPALHLAELVYESGDIDGARALIDEFLPLATQTGLVDQLVAAFQTKLRIAALTSIPDALAVLDEGEEISIAREFDRLHAYLVADRIRLLAAAGDVAEVRRAGVLHNLSRDFDRLQPARGMTSVSAARAFAAGYVGLVDNNLNETELLLRRWLRFLEERGCARFGIRFANLLAHVQLMMGEEKAAHRTLRTGLQLGLKGHFMRSFADANVMVRTHLSQMRFTHPNDAALGDYHTALIKRIAKEHGTAPKAAIVQQDMPVGPSEALNARESEILLMISTGMMNIEIAEEAGLTLGTVKWYLQQIYAKLGVKRRSEAVFRARQLGLIA